MQSLEWVRTLIETESNDCIYDCHSFAEAMVRYVENGQPTDELNLIQAKKELYLKLTSRTNYTTDLADVLPLLRENLVSYHLIAKKRNLHSNRLIDIEALCHSGLIAPLELQINVDCWPEGALVIEREATTTNSKSVDYLSSAIELRTLDNVMTYYLKYYSNILEIRFYPWPITN